MIQKGVCRPGALRRSIEGLTTKVLNERLVKMVQFGILEKQSYPEIPPRVEYTFTNFGSRLKKVLDAIEDLQKEVSLQYPAREDRILGEKTKDSRKEI